MRAAFRTHFLVFCRLIKIVGSIQVSFSSNQLFFSQSLFVCHSSVIHQFIRLSKFVVTLRNMNRVASATKLGFKKVSHVIFDLDGLLLDTEKLYTKAVQNVVSKYGKTYEWADRLQVLGLTGPEAAKLIVKRLELPITWEDYYRQAKEQYAIILPAGELLPDTESVHTKVFGEIAKSHGKSYTNLTRAKIIGTVEEESAKIYVRETQVPLSPENLLHEFKSRAMNIFKESGVAFMPGAERLVRHFHKNKIPIAVATGSGEDTYAIKTERHKEFFSLFSHVVAAGTDPEVKHGKPSPDVFLVCASRFKDKPKPEQCLVLEDAPNGVEAAVSAGMQVVMVPDKQTDESLCKKATLKLNSLLDMKPELFGLPPLDS